MTGGGKRMRLALAGVMLVAFAGCSSNQIGQQQQGEMLNAVVQAARSIGQPRASVPEDVAPGLTRAAIDGSPLPLLLATIEATGATAVLGLSNTNAGTQSYATADRVVITLRDGVVISTAGFGPDLRSSAGPTGRQVAAGSGATRRVNDYLDGTDRMVQVALDCTLAPAGSETLVLFERAYATRIVTETCGDGIQNRYWIEGGGKIRQSRQWIGADLGYLKIADLSR